MHDWSVVADKSGPQKYLQFDDMYGFKCLDQDQDNEEPCYDYEIQLCCEGDYCEI